MPALTFLGRMTVFYLPSHKLDHPRSQNTATPRQTVHDFLIGHYKAYTHTPSPVKGWWTNPAGSLLHDVMERFEVSFDAEPEFEALIAFLEKLCDTLGEESIYLTRGDESFLVRRTPDEPTFQL